MDGIRLRIGSDLNNLFRRARQEIAVKRGTSATVAGPLVAASSLMNRSLWYKQNQKYKTALHFAIILNNDLC